MRDYERWHEKYDDPGSDLSWRLGVVREYVRQALDERPGAVRALSLCAGDGRDLIGVLAGRPDADRVAATFVEVNPRLADRARRTAREAGLERVDVRTADAGLVDTWADVVPADLVLLVGILGNITTEDIGATLTASPQLCTPGAALVWSRGLRGSDTNDHVRGLLSESGFTELGYRERGAEGERTALGVVRYDGPPVTPQRGARLFTFVN